MKYKVIAKLSLKNLWAKKSRTIITTIGIVIGIGSIIFLVSLGYGLEKLVTSQVTNFEAFTILDIPSANLKTLKIDQGIIDKILALPHVSSVVPVNSIAGRIGKSGTGTSAETVVVAAGKDYWQLANIEPSSGALPLSGGEAMVNLAVLKLLGETEDQVIGKTFDVDLLIPSEIRSDDIDSIKTVEKISVKIVGVEKDEQNPIIYAPTELISAHGADKYISLKLKADKKESIPELRKQLENLGLSTEYVGDTVDQIGQVFVLFRLVLAIFGLVALVVAALGTFNTLTINLLERTREVGLFKALGMQNNDIYKLFVTEAIIIGALGGFFGVFLGLAMSNGINIFLSIFAQRAGADVIRIFITPWTLALVVGLFSIFVGLLTGLYPAFRAIKIDALDALRYE